MELSPYIFRAYDIRGRVPEQLNSSVMREIGRALGSSVLQLGEKQMVIGCDGRLSSAELLAALSEGIRASGCDVLNLGLVPTPLVYYATYVSSASCGAMVTGSHNPAHDNGVKAVFKHQPLREAEIKQLYQRIVNQDFTQGKGQEQNLSLFKEYQQQVLKNIRLKRRLKVVVDAGHAVAALVAPAILEQLGCDVIPLFCEIDGHFPNHHPDPCQVENLAAIIAAVKTHQADIGLAFDGDGDRLTVITEQGEIIWSDRQLMLFADHLLNDFPNSTVIYDVKCSRHVAEVVRAKGGQALMCRTGHALIKTKMADTGALLGGEMSGHIYFKDRWFGFDDATYTAVRLLEILTQDTRSCHEVFATLPNSVSTTELRLSIDETQKAAFLRQFLADSRFLEGERIVIDGLRVEFPQGWGLLRASNTTPHLMLRFEADDIAALHYIQTRFVDILLSTDKKLGGIIQQDLTAFYPQP